MDELSLRRTRKMLAGLSEAELIEYGGDLLERPEQVVLIGALVVGEFVNRYPELRAIVAC